MASKRHTATVTTSDAATPGLSTIDRLRETYRTLHGQIDSYHATHCRPDGDWRPAKQTPTRRVWTYPHTGVRVILSSVGVSRGWTVALEDADGHKPVVAEPTTRGIAFERARETMRQHVEQAFSEL